MTDVTFSVIVPARRCGDMLLRSLAALHKSDLPRSAWELIVVDDGSDDDTAEVAAPFADILVRIPDGPRGPAFARNRGVERARGEYVVFVDADVCVHPDVLRRFGSVFGDHPDVVAVFGAYDTSPPVRGLVSQYRNLLHHYVHWVNAGDADTFWAGCGAVRRSAFMAAGMFDENRFPRPQIEDIELGYRLGASGQRILLCPEIQGTHLKRWTFRRMVVTDFSDRAVPWMRLLLERSGGGAARGGSLNIKHTEKALTLLVGISLLALVLAAALADWRWLVLSLACIGVVIAGNAGLIGWFARKRGAWFALRVIPLRLLFYVLSGTGALWAILLHFYHGDGRGTAPSLRGAIS